VGVPGGIAGWECRVGLLGRRHEKLAQKPVEPGFSHDAREERMTQWAQVQ
jgi:hypothetical protein